ncbi:hypothetical protein TWF694_002743 [Orbilia ellipsospora]|uniref:Uncharacterized protein n=1 Tax=Orbilia ellipsospora TaxID=2528407 RepID=A0AAV9X8Z6_9PEZI
MRSVLSIVSFAAVASALVASPRPRDASQGRTANVIIGNDWGKSLTVTTTNNKSMSKALQSPLKITSSTPSTYSIQSSDQGGFTLSFQADGSKLSAATFDLGSKTGYTLSSSNPTTQLGVLAAPAGSQPDYKFYIFSGQGDGTSTVQNLIDTKLMPKLQGIKSSPVKLSVQGVDATITDVINPVVKSTYATLAWSFLDVTVNTIITFSGQIKLTVTYQGTTKDVTVTVTNFTLLVTGSGTVTNLSSIKVSRAQASVDVLSSDNTDFLVAVVRALYPALASVLGDTFKLGSVINTSENANVITLVNNAIQKFASG